VGGNRIDCTSPCTSSYDVARGAIASYEDGKIVSTRLESILYKEFEKNLYHVQKIIFVESKEFVVEI
jgi:hypothetical protein